VAGDTAVVGAFGDNDDVKGSNVGAAYVFVRSGNEWPQQAKLLASDGAAFDSFGQSVAVVGDTAVVGAPMDDNENGTNAGAAYVFLRSGTSWQQQVKLLPLDGASSDQFGFSVAVAGDTAVVGAPFDDDNSNERGAAYVFTRNVTFWSPEAKLQASDGMANSLFGWSVAIAGDTAVVGAAFDDNIGADQGAAYAFVRIGTLWSQQAKLLASDGAPADQFGWSVAVAGDTAVVGAHLNDEKGSDAGAAYTFVRSGSSWPQQAKLLASDGASPDHFGESVAVAGDTAVVGAPFDAINNVLTVGSAYVFDLTLNSNGEPCTANAECASGFCVDGVCCNTACAGLCDVCSTGTCTPSPAGFECRAAAGACDVAETCNGITANCPPDAFKLAGTLCDEGDPCTQGDTCFAGKCQAGPPAPNKTPCDDGDLCTQLDFCLAGICEGKKPMKCKKGFECDLTGQCSSQ